MELDGTESHPRQSLRPKVAAFLADGVTAATRVPQMNCSTRRTSSRLPKELVAHAIAWMSRVSQRTTSKMRGEIDPLASYLLAVILISEPMVKAQQIPTSIFE